MKILPPDDTPVEKSSWKPKPGEYFLWAHPSATMLYLCKWWDKNGLAFINVKDVSGMPCNEGQVTYARNHPYMAFTKPSEQFMEEFVPELKEVDYAELFHKAETDVKETFSGFMTKIISVT